MFRSYFSKEVITQIYKHPTVQICILKTVDNTFRHSLCLVFSTCFLLKFILTGPLECTETPKCLAVLNGCIDILMDHKSQTLNAQ